MVLTNTQKKYLGVRSIDPLSLATDIADLEGICKKCRYDTDHGKYGFDNGSRTSCLKFIGELIGICNFYEIKCDSVLEKKSILDVLHQYLHACTEMNCKEVDTYIDVIKTCFNETIIKDIKKNMIEVPENCSM